ncbi:ABC transporter ATP-binding protein [Aureibacillus halotolerans]|uniref:Multiple sugar transport system ATP-binding protein/inositol-phosphate transport system ATP-binding protein n=1 Tax=Aureibacillus halotolerans TaxID=1508390 RepID=A0A4R6U306_9BACI|nr:ABC transporter ATP-binding protein [Aureibacillus halotolerans]TDQ39762.1 multiple sugar transport system ATP-binding protein/inositol-phosphate transport system ATP-binding protein [Aureibacillus halotolerans]
MDVVMNNVTMMFQSSTAIKNTSLSFQSGRLTTLLGPSGCGKSTTLFLLAGIYKPSNGSIYFGDRDVTKVEPEDRGVGMVFQNYALYPHMSVLKNIMFPLKMMRVPKAERFERAMDMAKLVKIDHLADRKPKQLSGGQQQRVAIARALVKQPSLLLLDEPLSNLDARLRLEMRDEIRRIQQETKVTTVFVTHDQDEAMSIADHIALMHEGDLQQQGSGESLYRTPANQFVASFLGTPPMNWLNVSQTKNNSIMINETKSALALHHINLSDCSQEMVAGVRPEHVHIHERGALSGKVLQVYFIGRDRFAKIALKDGDISALLYQHQQVDVGDFVHAAFSEEHLHLFDKTTKENCFISREEDENERTTNVGIHG